VVKILLDIAKSKFLKKELKRTIAHVKIGSRDIVPSEVTTSGMFKIGVFKKVTIEK